MSDTELMDFIRYFSETRDWATWDAIADRYAECEDEDGIRIELQVKEDQ